MKKEWEKQRMCKRNLPALHGEAVTMGFNESLKLLRREVLLHDSLFFRRSFQHFQHSMRGKHILVIIKASIKVHILQHHEFVSPIRTVSS